MRQKAKRLEPPPTYLVTVINTHIFDAKIGTDGVKSITNSFDMNNSSMVSCGRESNNIHDVRLTADMGFYQAKPAQ